MERDRERSAKEREQLKKMFDEIRHDPQRQANAAQVSKMLRGTPKDTKKK